MQMKYAFDVGEKKATVECSDDLTSAELEVVKEMLGKLIDTRIADLKIYEQHRLSVDADIDSMYPELSVRARNVLKRNGCNTIADVLNCTPTDLSRMRNMGKRSLEEIMERCGKYGQFKEEGGDTK